MNSIERFIKTVRKEEVDRPACWLGIPDTEALPALFKHFGVSDYKGLKKAIDDDLYHAELPYSSPFSSHIYSAFDFAKKGTTHASNEERTLTTPGFFEDHNDPSDVSKFDWPEPEKHISPDKCRKVVAAAPNDKAVLGILWSAHFQDTCAAFGMENAFVNMISNPEMFTAIDNKITDFYLRANRIFYENTRDKLHAVLIGNDMGSQQCLMLSKEMICKFVLPNAKKLIDQAHSYGVSVIYHSCGAVSEIFDDLIALGVDVIHPIQALASGMNPEGLKEKFGKRVCFCGGVDAQNLLVRGTPDEVAKNVLYLKKLFPTGLVISPSHEAILPDISPENVEALFKAVKEK